MNNLLKSKREEAGLTQEQLSKNQMFQDKRYQ